MSILPEDKQIRETAAQYGHDYQPAPAHKVSFEEFLEIGDEDTWAEWVEGEVIYMSPATTRHAKIAAFLVDVLRNYASLRKLGMVVTAPFLVRLPVPDRGREPDVVFIRQDRLAEMQRFYFPGAPDLVVEITSPESISRDRGEKFVEYEAAGVQEYWLIDPDRQQAEFYHLDEKGRYRLAMAGASGIYRSQVISGLWLKIEWLWEDPLPSGVEVLQELGLVTINNPAG